MAHFNGIETFFEILKGIQNILFIKTNIYTHDIFSKNDQDDDIIPLGNIITVKPKNSEVKRFVNFTEDDITRILFHIEQQRKNSSDQKSFFYEGICYNKNKTGLFIDWGS
jgi:hypothetical protein